MKKNKIGLFTMPLTTNYGGIIQLIALQDYLISQGHETLLINRRYPESFLKRTITNIVESGFFIDIKHIRFRKKMASNIDSFINQYISQTTSAIYDEDKLKKIVLELGLDAVVVGSDQVWRMDYMFLLYKNAFLNFVTSNNTKKIAYAASFGKDAWTASTVTQDVKSLLKEFDAISVRENTGIDICKKEFDCENVTHVVDPTLLWDQSYYEKYLKNVKPNGAGIFTYVLDTNEYRNQVISTVAQKVNLPVHKINIDKDINKLSKVKNYKLPPLEEWLKGFKEADFVVTDSFHGTIFSIIFNKPFVTVVNEKRGTTRFTSLLRLLELEDRLVYDGESLNNSILNKTIDYKRVNEILDELRTHSKSFLNNALKS